MSLEDILWIKIAYIENEFVVEFENTSSLDIRVPQIESLKKFLCIASMEEQLFYAICLKIQEMYGTAILKLAMQEVSKTLENKVSMLFKASPLLCEIPLVSPLMTSNEINAINEG